MRNQPRLLMLPKCAMQIMAKQVMKSSAEKRGISWDSHVQALMADPELKQIKQELEQPGMQYPSYYLQPFHACGCATAAGPKRDLTEHACACAMQRIPE